MTKTVDSVLGIVEAAKKLNLDAFEVEASLDKGFSATARQGSVENLEHHREKSLHITVYTGQKTGVASTSDFSESALQATLEKACQIAKYTEPDTFSGLADKALMAFDYPELALSYPWDISHKGAIELALACDEQARAFDKRITQTIEAACTTNSHHRVYANSHDFVGELESTMHGLSVSVLAQADDHMERDYAYCYDRNVKNVMTPAELAKQASMRALSRLHARKVKSTKCPVIFDARVAKSLLSAFINAISGANLYRKSSFLMEQLDKPIFPAEITITQYPHLKGGYGSAPFDEQGVRTKKINYVEQGILRNYVLGAYSARKLGLVTTGNAGGVFNLRVNHSGQTVQELCQQIGTGLLVTELMGQGVNLVNGDYSRGASGFWVERGEIQHPVHETTIAANLKDMFLNLVAVATDTDTQGNIHTGSMLVSEMTLA